MSKNRIPWEQDEIDRLQELVAEGLDWMDVTKALNKEFRKTRPFKADGETRRKRSKDSVYWYHKRLKDDDGEKKPRRKRTPRPKKNEETFSKEVQRFTITVKDQNDKVFSMITTEKRIDEINSSLKELF